VLSLLLLLPLCLTALGSRARAQGSSAATLAAVGGVSYSRLAGDAEGVTALAGAVAGVQIDVPASSLFGLRGEALYHQRRSRLLVGTAPQPEGTPRLPLYKNVRWNYLELALAGTMRPFGERFCLLAGPAVGVRLSRSEEYVRDYYLEELQQLYPNAPASLYDNLILSKTISTEGFFAAGCAGTVPLGRVSLQVEVRYQWGLQDLNVQAPLKLYSRSLTFLSGIAF
jgi:hypothetical protein